jgi:hypothetical protein
MGMGDVMDRINPFKLFIGAFVPNWLMERADVSPGAKLCYGRLCQFAGREGLANPRQETLAESLGVSVRSVRNYLDELVTLRLLEEVRKGRDKANEYAFLSHEWQSLRPAESCRSCGPDVRQTLPNKGGYDRQNSAHDRQDSAGAALGIRESEERGSPRADVAGQERPAEKPAEPAADRPSQALLATWRTLYRERYGREYAGEAGDLNAVRLVMRQASGDVAAAAEVFRRFLACEDEFYRRGAHALSMLAAQINRFLGFAPSAGRAATEQQTAKRAAERDAAAAKLAEDEARIKRLAPDELATFTGQALKLAESRGVPIRNKTLGNPMVRALVLECLDREGEGR